MVTNLTTKQIESIQIDEGLIFLDYGEAAANLLQPLPCAILNLTADTEKRRVHRLLRSREPPSK